MAEMDKLNRFINEKFGDLFRKVSYDSADPKRKFPNGFKYIYWEVKQLPSGLQEWWFCYSTRRNQNDKFVSWIYKWYGPKGKRRANFDNLVEHKYLRAARKRAEILYSKRCEYATKTKTKSEVKENENKIQANETAQQ